jgi:hypothetical protein
MNPNIREIGNVVKQMQVVGGTMRAPNFNQAAADIVKQGVEDKNAARQNYTPQLTRPITQPKKPL